MKHDAFDESLRRRAREETFEVSAQADARVTRAIRRGMRANRKTQRATWAVPMTVAVAACAIAAVVWLTQPITDRTVSIEVDFSSRVFETILPLANGTEEENEKNLDMLKDKYEKEIASLKEELQEAKKAVQDRSIAIDEAGSIAMAALKLNGVFEAAQAASQQYIENIRCLSERQASICAKRDAENRAENERRIKETADKCANMEYASRRKCETMETEAREKSEAYWAEVSQRLQSFYDNHEELKKLLNFSIPNNFNMGGNKL